jgi:hypothetical protein
MAEVRCSCGEPLFEDPDTGVLHCFKPHDMVEGKPASDPGVPKTPSSSSTTFDEGTAQAKIADGADLPPSGVRPCVPVASACPN